MKAPKTVKLNKELFCNHCNKLLKSKDKIITIIPSEIKYIDNIHHPGVTFNYLTFCDQFLFHIKCAKVIMGNEFVEKIEKERKI